MLPDKMLHTQEEKKGRHASSLADGSCACRQCSQFLIAWPSAIDPIGDAAACLGGVRDAGPESNPCLGESSFQHSPTIQSRFPEQS